MSKMIDSRDPARLDWLIESRAIISYGGKSTERGFIRGYWLSWDDGDETQPGAYETARAAIDAARKDPS